MVKNPEINGMEEIGLVAPTSDFSTTRFRTMWNLCTMRIGVKMIILLAIPQLMFQTVNSLRPSDAYMRR